MNNIYAGSLLTINGNKSKMMIVVFAIMHCPHQVSFPAPNQPKRGLLPVSRVGKEVGLVTLLIILQYRSSFLSSLLIGSLRSLTSYSAYLGYIMAG